jgi:FlaA1/EpsC-like NDP-sugar epimerase
MPGVFELISGRVSVRAIRDVQVEDLLRRAPVHVDPAVLSHYLGGARVLVTGAGGSIGSEICRQVAGFRPAQLVLLGHGENSIYLIERNCAPPSPPWPWNPVSPTSATSCAWRRFSRATSLKSSSMPQPISTFR